MPRRARIFRSLARLVRVTFGEQWWATFLQAPKQKARAHVEVSRGILNQFLDSGVSFH
jgi:hypothetical protein